MSIFKCKMCGGTLEINSNETVAACEYCGTKQTLPRLSDEKKANLYDRANHFRRNNEFDKAMSIYEQILNEDNTDAESYWSIVLCRYGIEYVEDPVSRKRIPTVNRAQFTSIFDDEDYKAALQYADVYQKEVYESEANAINEIQKGILAISQKEESFDVFICYKETDQNGRRTQDSVLAQELYYELLEEGFKVFFAKITLEDKLGQEYEPYIFAALNSAKVMVVLGTKPEHFNAVWVKNEWSRYLSLIKNGEDKMLIPAYRDMDPYDLPEEFSHLQAQDMSKLGFMQDLVRGIKKIVQSEEICEESQGAISKNTNEHAYVNIDSLLKRVFMFLEDGDWDSADEYCEKVLDINPESAQAYLGKLMAELEVRKQEELRNCEELFDDSGNYQKIIRFGDRELVSNLTEQIAYIRDRNKKTHMETVYTNAMQLMNTSDTEDKYRRAATLFQEVVGYKNAKQLVAKCLDLAERTKKEEIYCSANKSMGLYTISGYQEAIRLFEQIKNFKDSQNRFEECEEKLKELIVKKEKEKKAQTRRIVIVAVLVVLVVVFGLILNKVIIPSNQYEKAISLLNDKKYEEAISIFDELGDYKDSRSLAVPYKYDLAIKALEAEEYSRAISLLMTITDYKDSKQLINENKIKLNRCISAGGEHTVGLKADGTVIAVGENSFGQCNVSEWEDIIAVSAGYYHTVGLKSDGTVVAIGDRSYGQSNVAGWMDIVEVSAGGNHTVGLKADGTVVAIGDNTSGQSNVSNWKDIVAVSAGDDHTIGLRADGTVIAVGNNHFGQCDVLEWEDIIAVSAGNCYTVGLRVDGTVIAAGNNYSGQCDVSEWEDIIAVSAGYYHTVGLKSDGTVAAVGSSNYGQCHVVGWNDIVAISAGSYYTIGVKANGTVVAVGDNDYGQCTMESIFK